MLFKIYTKKKLVTYPRTDARVLSTAVAKEINKNLNGIAKGFKDAEIQEYIKKMVDEKYPTNNWQKPNMLMTAKLQTTMQLYQQDKDTKIIIVCQNCRNKFIG